MIIDRHLSVKIKRVSFLMALLVVAHHCYVGWGTPWQLLFDGVCNNSVPYFFCLSGFLMFRKYDASYSWSCGVWQSRIRTLFVPYVIWMLIGLVCLLLLNHIGRWSDPVKYDSFDWWLKALGVYGAPLGLRYLWFVRRLMIFVLLAPVFGFIVTRTGLLLSFSALFVYAFLGRSADVWQSLSFFSAGVWLSLRLQNRESNSFLGRNLFWVSLGSVILFSFLAFNSVFPSLLSECGSPMMPFEKLSRYLLAWSWIGVVWYGYDILLRKNEAVFFIDKFTGSSFFVYCFHGILWRLVREFNVRVDIYTCWGVIFAIAVTSTMTWCLMDWKMPVILSLLTGGRGGIKGRMK